jgi:hypothetical protein
MQLLSSLLLSCRVNSVQPMFQTMCGLVCADKVASMQEDGKKIFVGSETAESHGKLALEAAADRAKALDVVAHVAEAKCLFQLAKQRCAAHRRSNLV